MMAETAMPTARRVEAMNFRRNKNPNNFWKAYVTA